MAQNKHSKKDQIQLTTVTTLTATGNKRNMNNRKPFRTKALKAHAKVNCYKTKGGYYKSSTETLIHPQRPQDIIKYL